MAPQCGQMESPSSRGKLHFKHAILRRSAPDASLSGSIPGHRPHFMQIKHIFFTPTAIGFQYFSRNRATLLNDKMGELGRPIMAPDLPHCKRLDDVTV